VRRDTEESYSEYLRRLAEGAGVEASDEAALRRMDRRRKKKARNGEWVNPHDPEAEITRMKMAAFATMAWRRTVPKHNFGKTSRSNRSRSATNSRPRPPEPCPCGNPPYGQTAHPQSTPGTYELALPCLILRKQALTVSYTQT